VASLLATLVAAELVARMVLPPQQLVEVEHVDALPAADGPVEEREQEQWIDVVIDSSGHYGQRLNPNMRAVIRNHILSKRDIVIETNSIGLRHPDLGDKRDDEFRILVLGDSITFGDYVPFEQTVTAQLEQQLAQRGRRATVINAGMPGVSTSGEFYLYLEIREAVDPDLVLLAMYLNDAQDAKRFRARALPRPYASSRFLSWAANRFEGVRLRLWKSVETEDIDPEWREEFRAGRHLRSGDMFHDQDGHDFEVYNAAMDFGLAWNPQAWEILTRETRVFALAADEAGHDFAVFLFPVHFQPKGTIEPAVPQQRFSTMCRVLGLTCLDLLPTLRQSWQSGDQDLYFDHCHLTPNGNRIVAESLADWLVARGMVPKTSG
jgi:lysophospholipase L1-like esterase